MLRDLSCPHRDTENYICSHLTMNNNPSGSAASIIFKSLFLFSNLFLDISSEVSFVGVALVQVTLCKFAAIFQFILQFKIP